MAELPSCVRAALRKRGLLPPGSLAVVAVSGGLDSMVLLEVLHRLRIRERWRLVVAHFNHRLRGAAGDRDEAFVRKVAQRLEVPCVIAAGEVRAHAVAHGCSVEMAARTLRHAFLARAAREAGAGTVLLAHHGDDQVETFFLRLLRGASVGSLAGMRFASPSPADAAIQLVRPFLERSKAELADYARKRRIAFREDATNRRLDAQRNVIRHRLLPLIRRRLQPVIGAVLTRLLDQAGEEAAFAEAAAASWLARTRRPGFEDLPVAVQRRVLLAQLLALGASPTFELVERLRQQPGCAVIAARRLRIWRDERGMLHHGPAVKPMFQPDRVELSLSSRGGEASFGGLGFRWRRGTRRTGSRVRLRPENGRERFDADRVGGCLVLRHWQAGDRFQPLGMAGATKLQDLFTNAHVPRAERHRRVVATNAAGEIVWVEGLRPGDPFKLTRTTRSVLDWRWRRATGEVASKKPAC